MSVWWSHSDDGRVFEVTISRPEALNAVDFETMEKLELALDEAEASADLRVFVLRGDGDKAFISGGDLKEFAALSTAAEGASMARRMVAILERIEALPCLTVAGINGPAYGGGTETALAFDIRIAAAHASMGFTQTKFAVPPGWGGLTRMVRLVGRSRALHWLATGAIVEAEQALNAGLVNAVAGLSFDDFLADQVRRMARNSPEIIATLKAGSARAEELSRVESIAAELTPFAEHWGSDDHHARVAAFFARE